MSVGDEWIYRLRDYESSERVRVLAIEQRKTSVRADVEFLDGDKHGTCENVPGGRLRGPWSTIERYDWLMANWKRLEFDDFDISEVEDSAISVVFDEITPENIASREYKPVRDAVAVHDRDAFESLIGAPLTEITSVVQWFDLDGTTLLSPAAGLLIAELICRQNPMPVLDWVVKEEAEIRDCCKRGHDRFKRPAQRKDDEEDPQRQYRFYLKYDRPRHELLRQWCGHRAVTFQERLITAEAEVHRLAELVAELIDVIERHDAGRAADMKEEHWLHRFESWMARPVVDRPLEQWEIPVVYTKTRQRRWW